MRAKVRNYKIILDSFDSLRGTYFKKEPTPSIVQVYFDENMYIEKSEDLRKDYYKGIVLKYIYKYSTEDVLMEIEFEINKLLDKYRDMNLLFLESDSFLNKKKEMLILHKENHFDKY